MANTQSSLEILRQLGAGERVACHQGNFSDSSENTSRSEKRELKLGEEKGVEGADMSCGLKLVDEICARPRGLKQLL